jgi:hypothetical protein
LFTHFLPSHNLEIQISHLSLILSLIKEDKAAQDISILNSSFLIQSEIHNQYTTVVYFQPRLLTCIFTSAYSQTAINHHLDVLTVNTSSFNE